MDDKDVQRFWSKVDKSGGEDACWEWQAGITSGGYGEFSLRGKMKKTHRIAWMIINGEIPPKMLICHHCDNRKCCNPKHLFLGTHQDNCDDKIRKGREVRLTKEQHGMAKLSQEDIDLIRKLYRNGGISQHKLALRFNVSDGNIWWIVTNRTWKE